MRDLVIIGGPTATGKTKISVDICKKINGAVISADSVQVYKYMDIGSAKVTQNEMAGVDHYLIDEFYPDEKFNVAKFQKYATKYINKIENDKKIPVIVGGTGFYINSIIYNNDFSNEDENTEIRQKYEEIVKNKGKEYLYELLKKIDIKSCEKIHFNNVKRVIRALEFYEQNGYTISEHNINEKSREAFYNTKMVILNMERTKLYERINNRVDIMVKNGLIDEVKSLVQKGYRDTIAMEAIGYKEILMYLDGVLKQEEAIELIKQESRRFAKRQVTWFRHQNKDNALWIDVLDDDYDTIINKILDYINDRG